MFVYSVVRERKKDKEKKTVVTPSKDYKNLNLLKKKREKKKGRKKIYTQV